MVLRLYYLFCLLVLSWKAELCPKCVQIVLANVSIKGKVC